MSRDPRYQKLLNAKQWKQLRADYLRAHPLCERCQREGEAAGIPGGYVSAAIDVHHKVPVETAKTAAEMERLCYDPRNLEALCIPCHCRTHQEMGKGTKALSRQRAQERMQRWADSIQKRLTNAQTDVNKR
jgi:5-methylcytosine-specific restriction protein A